MSDCRSVGMAGMVGMAGGEPAWPGEKPAWPGEKPAWSAWPACRCFAVALVKKFRENCVSRVAKCREGV